MGFMMSPGVEVKEYDLSLYVSAAATAAAAYVGAFEWGPCDEIETISSEEKLLRQFGRPFSSNYQHWFACKNFLDYSRNLKVVRVVDGLLARNASTGSTSPLIKNESEWNDNYSTGQGASTIGEFVARYPGELGNSLGVYVADYNVFTGVESITITSDGEGYTTAADNGDAVTFSAAPSGGTTATGVMVVTGNVLTGITITNPGSGYRYPPTVTIPAPTGDGTTATATAGLWKYYDAFLAPPKTSSYVERLGGYNDEMHIAIVDETGKISGTKGEILEKFAFVSKASDAKYETGQSSYYRDVLTGSSNYVLWTHHISGMTNWGQPAAGITFTSMTTKYEDIMTGGVSSMSTIDNNELMAGWQLFRNTENVDIGIIISGSCDKVLQEYLIQNVAERRKDCVVCISPELSDVVDNLNDELQDVIGLRDVLTSSSYGIMDCNWKYQFDMYNNVFRWLPCNPDVAGLLAYTEENRDAWWSPAGFNRGHIKNCVKLAWNPDQTDRDELYSNGINPIVTFKGEGSILYGDKTMLTKPSAFDRINVRRLFIVLEKAIAKASKYVLFEFNDIYTRERFNQLVDPFLRDVVGRRGIDKYKIVCDDTVNTPYVVDSNGFVANIYISPNRSINFIQLNFVATSSGANFEEIQNAPL